MIADYMTKPLQGKFFKRFRNLIMRLRSPSERIVEKDDKTCLAKFPVGMFAKNHVHRSVLEIEWKSNRQTYSCKARVV